jgi:hypothetical protein
MGRRRPSLDMKISVAHRLLAFGALVSAVGCAGGDPPEIDCDTATVKGYAELGEAFSYCTQCHGATRADEGIALHTYELAVEHASRSERSIANGSMPPDETMPESLETDFYTWAQCGTPP